MNHDCTASEIFAFMVLLDIDRQATEIYKVVNAMNAKIMDKENNSSELDSILRKLGELRKSTAQPAYLSKSEAQLFPFSILENLLAGDSGLAIETVAFNNARRVLVKGIIEGIKCVNASVSISPSLLSSISSSWLACEAIYVAEIQLVRSRLKARLETDFTSFEYLRESRKLEKILPELQRPAQHYRSCLALEAVLQRLDRFEVSYLGHSTIKMPYESRTFRKASFLCPEIDFLSGLGVPTDSSELKRDKSTHLLNLLQAVGSAFCSAQAITSERFSGLNRDDYPELVTRLKELRHAFDAAYRLLN